MTAETHDVDPIIPSKNPIVLLMVLGSLNILAAALVLVLQVGVVIVGKSLGVGHVGLAFGWLVTGGLGAFLLVNAQAMVGKRRKAIEHAKRARGLEHTRELQRSAFNFDD